MFLICQLPVYLQQAHKHKTDDVTDAPTAGGSTGAARPVGGGLLPPPKKGGLLPPPSADSSNRPQPQRAAEAHSVADPFGSR